MDAKYFRRARWVGLQNLPCRTNFGSFLLQLPGAPLLSGHYRCAGTVSSGSTQSRPFPARAVKVMESEPSRPGGLRAAGVLSFPQLTLL